MNHHASRQRYHHGHADEEAPDQSVARQDFRRSPLSQSRRTQTFPGHL